MIKKFSLLFILALAIIGVSWSTKSQAQTTAHNPNIFINKAELDAIKQKVQAGQQPWKAAYDKLITQANTALNQNPLAVTDDGGGNTFHTDKPYSSDGVYDPNAKRGDYLSAHKLNQLLPQLGLAYKLTGDPKYAVKAHELIKVWAINPATAMTPVADNPGGGGVIELYVTIPGIIYGTDLIWDYSGWTSTQRTAMNSWVKDIGNDARTRRVYSPHNFENWRLVLVSSSGAFVGDQALLTYAFNRYKEVLPLQLNTKGEVTSELHRTRSLFYSLYALNAMTQAAEIARHNGVDLYNFASGGKSLKLALDYHDNYAINPASWPYEQIDTIKAEDGPGLYEMAYGQLKQQSYLDVVNKYTRPMNNIRIAGPVTLTHGNRFDLSASDSPTPTPTPAPSTCPSLATTHGSATMTVTVPTTGSYRVWTRLMAPNTTNNSVYLQIDETTCGVNVGDNAITANQWTWVDHKDGNTASKISVNLTAGTHTIRLIGREAGVKVDRILLLASTSCVPTGRGDNCVDAAAPPSPTEPNQATANPNASPRTKEILNYFQKSGSRSQHKAVSGQHIGNTSTFNDGLADIEKIKQQTGEYVGIIGADFDAGGTNYTTLNPALKAYAGEGGLITMTIHPENPKNNGDYHDRCVDIQQLITPGTLEYNNWRKKLDAYAIGLQYLEDNNIPVLWRPFHEMTQGNPAAKTGQCGTSGFWWSYGNPTMTTERYKTMWKQMFDYLTTAKGLNNILWVYEAHVNDDGNQGRQAYYPGDNYVDIVGVSDYKQNHTATIINQIKQLHQAVPQKPFWLAEVGPNGDCPCTWDLTQLRDLLKNELSFVSGFVFWTGGKGMHSLQNSSTLLQDPWIANRGDIIPESNDLPPTTTPSTSDLIVTSITTSPVNPKPGDKVTFNATIKNQGTAPTPGNTIHSVGFSINGTEYNFSDNFTGPLAPGAEITLSANGPAGKATWPASDGSFTLEAHVDYSDNIEEANNGNNIKALSFVVISNPRKPGDFNDNGHIDMSDLSVLLSAINRGDISRDINNDGKTNMQDLSILLSGFN